MSAAQRPGFPPSVVRGSFRFLSGLAGAGPGEGAAGDGWIELAEAPWRRQAEAIFDALADLQADAGGIGSVLRLHLYQQDKRLFPVLETVRLVKEGAIPSPSSGIGVAHLHGSNDVLYEADGLAISSAGLARFGPRDAIQAGGAGKSASHYSQFSRLGPYVFMAGVIPIEPTSMRPVVDFDDVEPAGRFLARGRSHPDSRTGPIAAQTWFVYQRILRALDELGIPRSQVCGSTVFLRHAADAADLVRVHAHIFGDEGPALNLVCVDEVGHRGTIVEIEVTAVDRLPLQRVPGVGTSQPPRVVRAGELALVSDELGITASGQLATSEKDLDPADVLLPTFSSGAWTPHAVQLVWALRNLRETLQAASLPLDAVGQLWVRLARPCDPAIVAPLVAHVLGSADVAITVTEAHAIPQSPRAVAAVSALLGGLDEV